MQYAQPAVEFDSTIFDDDWMGSDLLLGRYDDHSLTYNGILPNAQVYQKPPIVAMANAVIPSHPQVAPAYYPGHMNAVLPISSSDAKGSTKIKREASSTIVTKTKTSCTAVTKRRKIGQMSIKDEELEEYRQKLPKKEFIKALFPPDLRHSYSRIIVDAFNTGNSTLMIDALKSFCAPNVSVREYFTGVDNPYGPNYRELCGYEAIATYWNIISSAIPDGIITVKNTKAKPVAKVPDSFSMVIDSPEFDERDTSSEDNSEPNGGSAFGESLAFINSYSFNGTKLLDIVTQQHKFAKNPPIFGPEVPDYGPSSIYLVPTRDNIDNKIRPDVRLEGSWVILLDKNNKISRFEFHYRNALERRNL